MTDPSNSGAANGVNPTWHPIVRPGMEHIFPGRDLWVNPKIPFVTYVRWVWEWRVYLTLLCGLRQDDAVLEIGCNHGRTMLGLIEYLKSPGRYEGFDIQRDQVEHAHRHIGSPDFQIGWHHADVHHPKFNPNGKDKPASEYEFPYGDEEFNVAYAASVFTHMVPADAENYFRQTYRVLKPGGRALFSIFVLDWFQGEGTTTSKAYDFIHPLPDAPDVCTANPESPEDMIAYKQARWEKMAADAGLTVTQLVPGHWSKSHPVGVCGQDLLVLAKPEN